MPRWVIVVSLAILAASCAPKPAAVNTNSMAVENKFRTNLPDEFVEPTDDVGRRLFREYGAVFVARGGAVPPWLVVFEKEVHVVDFQHEVSKRSETIGGVEIVLQTPAMKALESAVEEARQAGMTITPRGSDAAMRSYKQTVELWASRVEPGLKHWVEKGRVPAADAKRILALSPHEQVAEIFRLEAEGIYFSKDLSKSIIYSVAPPGASQHLSMLALDVTEHDDARVRAMLANHGWFQTVVSDLPHFTFLGAKESELPELGLKKVESGGRTFWLPALD